MVLSYVATAVTVIGLIQTVYTYSILIKWMHSYHVKVATTSGEHELAMQFPRNPEFTQP